MKTNMLIGFSVSHCIADIMDGEVNINDVLIIVGGTLFDEHNIDKLVNSYCLSYWRKYDPKDVKEVLTTLLKHGKIHQPRQFPFGHAFTAIHHWMRLVHDPINQSPAAKRAWEQYLMISAMSQR